MYEKYWGLEEKPFQNTPDPHFFYYSSQHKEAFSKLAYTIEEKMGASVLTGVFGCGKTVLARTLLEKLHASGEYKTALITHPQLSRVEFLRAIVSSLGAVNLPTTKADLLSDFLIENLKDILTRNMKDGKHTIIIIDEAHVIKDIEVFEEMRLLLNFQLNKKFLLTLLIIGQPDLKKNISINKQLLQRISFFSHLTNFNKSDAHNYILHRLKVAKAKKAIFSDQAIDMVYRKSGGIPRRINQICDTALFLGAEQKNKSIEEGDILKSLEYSGEIGLETELGAEEETAASKEGQRGPFWKMGWTEKERDEKGIVKEKGEDKHILEKVSDIDLDEPESQNLYNNCIMLLENTFNRLGKDKKIEAGIFISLSHQLIDKLKKEPVSLWVLTNKSCPRDSSYLHFHSLNTAILSILLGLELDYDDNRLSKLAIAALMHDIGMCKVPKEIIEKKAKLTDREYEVIKQHPFLGSELLLKKAPKELNGITARVILEHHENLNGSGYPNKKFANQIVEFSKIVGLSNIYESLIHSRIYRPRFGPYRAMVEIIDLDEKGFFDKSLVKVFIQKFSFYPIGSWVKLNTDEIARVLAINKSSLVSPTVKIILDSQKQPLDQPKIVDLASRPKFSIKEAIEDPREEPVLIEEDISASRLPKELYQELLSKTKQIFKKAK